MIGIALIQMYWINFSIRLDEKKFDERVISALKRVEERITKAEEENTNFPGITSNGLNYTGFVTGELEIGSLLKSDSTGRYDILNYGGYDPWQRSLMYWELRTIQNQLRVPPLQDRVDPKTIGTFIEQELVNRGIKIRYDYGVFDYELDDFIVINSNYVVQIGESNQMSSHDEEEESAGLEMTDYAVDLFPSEMGAPGSLRIDFPNKNRWLWGSVWPLILSSVLFMGLILACFAYTVHVIFRQKKVSEMKTDFINNMTHEFKTPIATISLATDSIINPAILSNEGKVKRFADIIKQENKRMLSQVEKVLQMALLDKKDFKLKMGEIDVHDLARQAVENMRLQVDRKDGQIKLDLQAEDSVMKGDPTHISNILHNLLDNANKYTPERPEIVVSTRNVSNGIEVRIKDNGIGLSKEAKKQIFDKFYRVHTGNIHDVKGFGLGLSYVKAMVTAHQGSIDVESELGKGSTFILTLPLGMAKVGERDTDMG